jgi:hypothetical protein
MSIADELLAKSVDNTIKSRLTLTDVFVWN